MQNKTALWVPQSKPQWKAVFSRADELFYGGAGGGGKSDWLLGMAGELHHRSIIFRRVFPNMRFLIERSRQIYNPANTPHGKDSYNESLHIWRLRRGNMVEFGAMQHEENKTNFQGRPHDFIGFDEAPEFTESQILFVSAWNRTTDPAQRVRLALTGNPPMTPAGNWIVRRYGAWLDKKHPNPAMPGELRWYATVNGKEKEFMVGDTFEHEGEMITPRSRTFIPARLDDNVYYAQDGRYKSVLQALPERMKRQLLYGDFDAAQTDAENQIIPTDWVLAAQERWLQRPRPTTPLTAVGIDPSRGGEDKTAIARRYDNWFDEVVTYDGVDVKDGASLADKARKAITGNPMYINIDVNGIGSSGYDHLKVMFDSVRPFNAAEGSEYRDRSGKLKMRNKRAEMYWRMRDALDPEYGDDIALPPGNEIVADLCSACYIPTISGIKVEEKSDIKERIGRSPDVGEAIMMALTHGDKPKIQIKSNPFSNYR